VAIATGLASTVAKIGAGMLVKQAIDAGIEARDMDALRTWSVLLGMVAVVSALFVGLRRYTAFRATRWIEA
jgi:ABC-type bacteriocin/lantibiotic exporter with double-glycine peptidase domain